MYPGLIFRVSLISRVNVGAKRSGLYIIQTSTVSKSRIRKRKKEIYRFKSQHVLRSHSVKKAAREQEKSNQEGRYPTGQKVEGDHPIAYSRE